jgi:hypothetical protein
MSPSKVRSGLRTAAGGAYYLLCLLVDLHYALLLAALSILLALLPTVGWPHLSVKIALWAAGFLFLGWGFWSLVRKLGARKVCAESMKTAADATETAAAVATFLLDPGSGGSSSDPDDPMNRPLTRSLLFWAVAALGYGGFAMFGFFFTDIISPLEGDGFLHEWGLALRVPGYQAFLVFMAFWVAYFALVVHSEGFRRWVRGLNHGRRFAGVVGRSRF